MSTVMSQICIFTVFPSQAVFRCDLPIRILVSNKKLSYCWDSSSYDKINDSGIGRLTLTETVGQFVMTLCSRQSLLARAVMPKKVANEFY